MISQTIVDLCDAVSELAAERDECRRKAESQAARHSDEVEALRAERDEARCSMFDAATDRDNANRAADKAQWDAEQLRRELAAMQAERTELTDLRAKLALQTQIATGAATQRDEQTARLKDALNQLESTTEVKVIVDAALCRATVDMESLRAEQDGLRAEVARLTEERDDHAEFGRAAMRRVEGLAAERDALKASKPAVDVAGLRRAIHRAWWEDSYDPASNVAKAALEYLGLTPAAPHDGRVSTNELTKEEVAFARGDGVLVVSDDGLGSVPREWYERAKKARAKTGEVGT